ncbi:alpha/beta hydrolase family protein [Catenovulum sp. SX2]|uniref:alpha/beta hydrolase family protein n=1 Tax=Catenovulum sp. SX2 TaxID=3398614 RepID=UPI003F827FC2
MSSAFFKLIFVCCCVIISGCASFKANQPKMLPLHQIFIKKDAPYNYYLSPSGKKLSWYQVEGISSVFVVKDLTSGIVKTYDLPKYYQGQNFEWLHDQYLLTPVSIKQNGVTTNRRLFMYDLVNEQELDIVPELGGNIYFHSTDLSKAQQGFYFVHVADAKSTKVDLYSYQLPEQSITYIDRFSPASLRSMVMFNSQVIITKTDSEFVQSKFNSSESWQDFSCKTTGHYLRVLAATDDYLYSLNNCADDFRQLIQHDKNGQFIAFDKLAGTRDVEWVLFEKTTGEAALAYQDITGVVALMPEYQWLAQSLAKLDGRIQPATANHFIHSNGSYLFKFSNVYGESFYLYQADQQTAKSSIKPSIKLIEAGQLDNSAEYYQPQVEEISLTMPQGHQVYAYLNKNKVKPIKGAVLLIHGGPRQRVHNQYDPMLSMLLDRGYAVLNLNYSGSTGYGREYTERAKNNISLTVNEITIAFNWLEDNLNLPADRIALMGGSFGGYLSLIADKNLANQCTVSYSGVYDLVAANQQMPGRRPTIFEQFIADKDELEQGLWDQYSPLQFDQQSSSKKLIVHGRQDYITRVEHARKYVNLLKQQGRQVRYLELEDDHNISNWYHQLLFAREVELFLADCLGGEENGTDHVQLFARLLSWFNH